MKIAIQPFRIFMAAILLLNLQFSACFAGGGFRQPGKSGIADSSLSGEIRRQLQSGELRGQLYYPKSVSMFYTGSENMPSWIRPQDGMGPAWQAMLMIDCVLQFGLSHNDYHPRELTYTQLHQILDTPGRVTPALQARYDIVLTDAIVTLMNHLHYGKLNPDYPSGRIDAITTGSFQAPWALIAGIRTGKIMETIEEAEPKAKEYTDMQRRMHLLEGIYQDDCYEVPQAEVRKIAINMERLRWANLEDSVYMHINIPSYTLKLYLKNTTCRFRVIVGKPSTPTPTLLSTIRYFTTAPEWKVPSKIFRKEILPKALADTGFLELNHYAIYDGKGNYVDANKSALALVRRQPEKYFARQSAGCDNALGLIIFRFPNIYDIYLHDTPEQKLFKKEERDLSHGCIRVEQAEKLAALLLKNDRSAGQIKALHQGVAGNINRNIYLKKPVPLKITYLTCEVNEGQYVTYPDVYQLDDSLEAALYGNLQLSVNK
ncbi:MAG: L,D-transpeptidase family protein [Bacteroidota bacterium]